MGSSPVWRMHVKLTQIMHESRLAGYPVLGTIARAVLNSPATRTRVNPSAYWDSPPIIRGYGDWVLMMSISSLDIDERRAASCFR